MPILHSTNKITPRSILRHRPIDGKRAATTMRTKQIKPGGETTGIMTSVLRASRVENPAQEGIPEGLAKVQKHGPQVLVNPKKTRKIYERYDRIPLSPTLASGVRNRFTKLSNTQYYSIFFLVLGMIVMLVLWTGSSVVNTWFTTWHDDLVYGRPRTFQTDAWVGHNEQNGMPSHFIAQNFHRRILVIEMPGGDATKSRVFMGPQLYGSENDLIPVTLTFMDITHDRKPDMIIVFQDTRLVYINTGTTFRPLLPSEQAQFAQFLRQKQ